MRGPSYAFVDLCAAALEMCAVKEGETVAILSQGDQRPDYAIAFMAASQKLGATPYHVTLPDAASGLDGDFGAWTVGATPLTSNRPVVELLKEADILIDLMFLLFSAEQLEIQAADTRILLCIEPLDLLARLFPLKEIRDRVEVGSQLLGNAQALRFTNDAGTDVTYELGRYPVIEQYGHTDTAGRWDHWPSGFVFTGGQDDGVDGTVVIAPGDILLPHKSYVNSPIRMTVEQGRIVDIRGDVDADLLKDYMESFDDDRAYGIAHIGWGLDHRARWSALATDTRGMGMEVRSFYGNVLFSTGPNGELGGNNDTACHVDIPMRNCSLYLDDEPIVIDGDIVVDEMKSTTGAR